MVKTVDKVERCDAGLDAKYSKMQQHVVRIGTMGNVGRFDAIDGTRHRRGAQVICRTSRGLEVGQVLAATRDARDADGTLLRGVTDQDALLIARIENRKQRAFEACNQLIQEQRLETVLMDVEHLFDGQSLFFYFLGSVDDQVEAFTAELAEAYEAKVQFRRFSETLANGCGPDCGTEDATGGCGEGGCGSCSLREACVPGRTL